MPQPVVTTRGVSKSFGGVSAVDRVDLDVFDNEFLALVGASGCGKTTLLRLISGLERADAGQIMIAGEDMTGAPPYRRPVNLMFQSYALFPHMTVAANVAFGLVQDGLQGRDLDLRVAEALELVEMTDFATRRPDALSGGQRQRVALARCLAKRPKVLLLDEPMAALDRALRERMRLEMTALRRRLGIAFVAVTHDQEDAMTMADRVAVMERGRIVQTGSPRDIYDAPSSRTVAGLFGQSNIWDGVVSPDGARVSSSSLGFDVRARAELPSPGSAVSIVVRPERISIDPVPRPDDNALADAIIEQVVFLGAASTYHVRAPHGALIRVARQCDQGPGLTVGSRVAVTWPASAVVVLQS